MADQGPGINEVNLSFATLAQMSSTTCTSLKQGSMAYVAAEDTGAGAYFKFMPLSTAAGGTANVKYASSALNSSGVGSDALAGRWVRLATIDHA